jgi:hypothetical protein
VRGCFLSGGTGCIIGPRSGAGDRRPITAGQAGPSCLLRNQRFPHFSAVFALFARVCQVMFQGRLPVTCVLPPPIVEVGDSPVFAARLQGFWSPQSNQADTGTAWQVESTMTFPLAYLTILPQNVGSSNFLPPIKEGGRGIGGSGHLRFQCTLTVFTYIRKVDPVRSGLIGLIGVTLLYLVQSTPYRLPCWST